MTAPRSIGRPRGRTPQGTARREALFQSAMALFTHRGFAEVSMRQLAKEGGVSAPLFYKYFPSKQHLVVELYQRCTHRLQESASERGLPAGSWVSRSLAATELSLEALDPYHRVLRGVLGELLVGDLRILGPQMKASRDLVLGVFREAAGDESLAQLAYLAHLGVILLWLLDPSEQQRGTATVLKGLRSAEPVLRSGAWLGAAQLDRWSEVLWGWVDDGQTGA